ncbi:hypothetical protein VPHD479_0399 [Vibrio phage D479]
MASDNKKQIDEIIARLDLIVMQSDDSPEAASMQRVAMYTSNVDLTTSKIFDKLVEAFGANDKQAEAQKSLFVKWQEAWQSQQSRMSAALQNVRDTIVAALDFNSHFLKMQNTWDSIKTATKNGFIRMVTLEQRLIDTVTNSTKEMRRDAAMQKLAQQGMQDYLNASTGQNAPLTVGWVSGLYNKIFTYNLITDTRARKTATARWKESNKFQRTLGDNVRRILTHLIGPNVSMWQKILTFVGTGFVMASSGLMFLSSKVGALATSNKLLGGMARVVSGSLKGLGLLSKGTGELMIDFRGTISKWFVTLVRQTFMGLTRVIGMMMNPVVLIGLVAGYSIYKIFEEEFDRIFAGLASIFGDPKKRAALWQNITGWFSSVIGSITGWFTDTGSDIAEMMPEGMLDSVISGVEWYIETVKNNFMMVINGVNKVIGAFASIPDAFQYMILSIEDMMNDVKLGIGKMISYIPGFGDTGEEMIADSEKRQSEIDKAQMELSERMAERMKQEYVQDAAKATVDSVKQVGKDIRDTIGHPLDAVGTSIENLNDNLALQTMTDEEMKALLNRKQDDLSTPEEERLWARLQVMDARRRSLELENANRKLNGAEMQRQQVVVQNQVTNNSVSDSSSKVSMSAPLTTSGSAKTSRPGGAL